MCAVTPNLPTNIVGFRGFDSITILIQRGGIVMSIGNLPESLSRAMLVGTMLVERLGVVCKMAAHTHAYTASPQTENAQTENL